MDDLNRMESLFIRHLDYSHADLEIDTIDPSEDDIRRAVGTWFKSPNLNPEDVVVFYYSGHGGCYNDGGHYICTTEYDPSNPAAPGAIDTSQLRQWFFSGERHPQNVLLILDTCYSGKGAADLIAAVARSPLDRTLPSDQAGLIVLTAARFHDEAEQSIFTTLLSDAIHDVGREHQSLAFIPIALITTWVNERLKTQKASHSQIGSCRDEFVPNPNYSYYRQSLDETKSDPGDLAVKIRRTTADVGHETERLLTAYIPNFVGRVDELSEIRSLLTREEPGYLLVRGIAGAGKSALLANLIWNLRTTIVKKGGAALIFHFIREGRTDTRRVLQSLNTQLLNYLEQEKQVAGDVGRLLLQFQDLWRQLMALASSARPVLLVLDGLDELADPDSLKTWLPGNLAPYTHVIVGVRTGFDPMEYLPREGHIAQSSDFLDLHNLNELESQELLAKLLGNPVRARQLAPRVMGITGGFPLATRLLGRKLAEEGESVLDHQHLSALMENYLKEEARQLLGTTGSRTDRRLLAILVCARGPLAPDELKALLQVNDDTFEQILRPVLRYLVSPTFLELMHHELKLAIARSLPVAEKLSANRALSDWVRSFAGSEGGTAIPRYVLDHFVAQMSDEHAFDALFATVLSPRWYVARCQHGGLHAEYVDDIGRVRDRTSSPVPNWPAFCKACHLLAQLRTVASDIPAALIMLLAELGRIDEAEDYASLDSDHVSKSSVFTQLAHFHSKRGEKRKAHQYLNRAESVLKYVIEPEKRCSLLRDLTHSFRDLDDLTKARTLAAYCVDTQRLVRDELAIEETVKATVDALLAVDEFDSALGLAAKYNNEHWHPDLITRIATALAAKGQIDRLLNFLEDRESTKWQFLEAPVVLNELAKHGYIDEAKKIAQWSDITDHGYAHICCGLAMRGDTAGCVRVLGEIGLQEDDEVVVPQVNGVWSRLLGWVSARRGLPIRVRNGPHYTILAHFYRRQALEQILNNFHYELTQVELVSFAERLDSAAAISSGLENVQTRSLLVRWLARRGASNKVTQILKKMKDDALGVERWNDQAEARCIVSEGLGTVGRWEEAFQVVESVLTSDKPIDKDALESARGSGCKALVHCGRFDEALRLNEEIESLPLRVRTLAEITAHLHTTGEGAKADDMARKVTELIGDIDHEGLQSTIRVLVAYRYAKAGLGAPALTMAATIADQWERDRVHDGLAHFLLEAGQLKEAQDAACAISNWSKSRATFRSLVRILVKNGKYQEALSILGRTESEFLRSETLSESANSIISRCTPYERGAWADRLVREAATMSGFAQMYALGQIGRVVLQGGDRLRAETIAELALEVAHGIRKLPPEAYLSFARACAEVLATEKTLLFLARRPDTETGSMTEVALMLAQVDRWSDVAEVVSRRSGIERTSILERLAQQAITRGQRERAKECAAIIRRDSEALSASQRAIALIRLAGLHLLLGDPNVARELARTGYDYYAKANDNEALKGLGRVLARAGQMDLVLECLSKEGEGRSRAWKEAEVAIELAESGQCDDAVNFALSAIERMETERDEPLHDLFCSKCVEALARAGRLDLASEKVALIKEPHERASALLKSAASCQQAPQQPQVEKLLQQVRLMIDNLTAARASVMRAELAAVFQKIGRSESAKSELLEALRLAEGEGLTTFLDALMVGASVLAAMDQGETLWEVVQGLEQCTFLSRRDGGVHVSAA
jgi:tetratricopeptide (TPR) repeat protein